MLVSSSLHTQPTILYVGIHGVDDVRVLIVAHDTADHSVGTDGVDDVGLFLGSLSARCGLQEEVIVISFLFLHHLVLLDVSGVLLDGVVVHRVVFAVDGADGEAWNGLRPGQTGGSEIDSRLRVAILGFSVSSFDFSD